MKTTPARKFKQILFAVGNYTLERWGNKTISNTTIILIMADGSRTVFNNPEQEEMMIILTNLYILRHNFPASEKKDAKLRIIEVMNDKNPEEWYQNKTGTLALLSSQLTEIIFRFTLTETTWNQRLQMTTTGLKKSLRDYELDFYNFDALLDYWKLHPILDESYAERNLEADVDTLGPESSYQFDPVLYDEGMDEDDYFKQLYNTQLGSVGNTKGRDLFKGMGVKKRYNDVVDASRLLFKRAKRS